MRIKKEKRWCTYYVNPRTSNPAKKWAIGLALHRYSKIGRLASNSNFGLRKGMGIFLINSVLPEMAGYRVVPGLCRDGKLVYGVGRVSTGRATWL